MMLKWLSAWFKKKPEAYAMSYAPYTRWVKVVLTVRPEAVYCRVVGPFRSEIDCEEYCNNMSVKPKVSREVWEDDEE